MKDTDLAPQTYFAATPQLAKAAANYIEQERLAANPAREDAALKQAIEDHATRHLAPDWQGCGRAIAVSLLTSHLSARWQTFALLRLHNSVAGAPLQLQVTDAVRGDDERIKNTLKRSLALDHRCTFDLLVGFVMALDDFAVLANLQAQLDGRPVISFVERRQVLDTTQGAT